MVQVFTTLHDILCARGLKLSFQVLDNKASDEPKEDDWNGNRFSICAPQQSSSKCHSRSFNPATWPFFATILKLDHSWSYYLTKSIQFPIMARYTQRLQDDEVKQIDIDNVDEDGCRYSSGVNHLIQLWGTTSFFAPMLNVRAIFEYAMEAVSRRRSLSNQMSPKIIVCAMALHLKTASMGIFVECFD